MKIQIHSLARLAAVVVAISPALAWGNGHSRIDQLPSVLYRPRPIAIKGVELPHGNPLTAPLNLSEKEQWLFADADDGQLDALTLVGAALVAGGVKDEAAIELYQERFDNLCRESRGLCESEADIVKRIEILHGLLHRQILRQYDPDATQLAATFDTGIYNCASATLLFVALATDAGLDVRAIELPGHVRTVVTDGESQWEVEMTASNWSESIRRIEEPTADRRDISPLGLISMVYYNQGIDAFHNRRFAAAVAANRRALLLDENNPEARGNLLASINNWALALCEAGAFESAASLLADGLKYDPSHQEFTHNATYVLKLRAKAQKTAGY